MPQNRVTLVLSQEDVEAIEAAITTLEYRCSGLIALSTEQRRELTKMGDKSEAFCRLAVTTLSRHPDVLPRGFDLVGYQSDLLALDTLRPIINRLERLFNRMTDTEMALGSDLMVGSLEGYAHLKVGGEGDGLDTMKEALGARFGRTRKEHPTPGT